LGLLVDLLFEYFSLVLGEAFEFFLQDHQVFRERVHLDLAGSVPGFQDLLSEQVVQFAHLYELELLALDAHNALLAFSGVEPSSTFQFFIA
jgi:hypothetical protein